MGNINFPCHYEPSLESSKNQIVKEQSKQMKQITERRQAVHIQKPSFQNSRKNILLNQRTPQINDQCQATTSQQNNNYSTPNQGQNLCKAQLKTQKNLQIPLDNNYTKKIEAKAIQLQQKLLVKPAEHQIKDLSDNKQNDIPDDDMEIRKTYGNKQFSSRKLDFDYYTNTKSIESLEDFNTTNFLSDYIIQTAKSIHDPITIQFQKFVQIHNEPIKEYYELQEKLGQGSYGCVYKAKCLKTGEFRAIKILKKKALKGKQKSTFMAQMELLKKLDHPNIIKLYEIFLYNNFYYVVMEYCCGGTIIDFLSKSGKYSEEIVKLIMHQILSAIRYIHQQQIVHRDVKLENMVFLNEVSQINAIRSSCVWNQLQNVCVKLIDFGSAIKCKYSKNSSKNKVGTTSYMAPQMIQGNFNDKCDIWSAGVILYILLCGKSPFKSRSRQETFFKIKTKRITCQEPQWQSVSEEAKLLVKLMLEKNYLERISAEKCLQHKWFEFDRQIKSSRRNKRATTIVINNLFNYYRQNNLVSVIQSFLAFKKISQDQRQQLARVFKKLDQDNSGSIDISELTEAFMQYNGYDDKQEIHHVLNKIDKNKSGKIDFNQFIAAVYGRKKLFVKQSLLYAFDFLDTGKTGFLEKSDLKNALKGCQKEQIQSIMGILDQNKDNLISKQQFVDYFVSLS